MSLRCLFAVAALGLVLAGCSSDEGPPTVTGSTTGTSAGTTNAASSGAGGSGAGATGTTNASTGAMSTSSATGPASASTSAGAGGASGGTGGASSGTGGASVATSSVSGTGGALADASGGAGGSAGGGSDGGASGSDAGARAMFVYMGGYGSTVSAFAFNPNTAALTAVGTPARVQQVSFMAWSAPTNSLYALSETNPGRVFAFSTNATTGAIATLNDAPTSGAGPAHVTADPTGKWLLVANYDGNNAAVLPLQPNGAVGATAADVQSFAAGTFPHEVALDPTERFAFVLLVGGDAIMQFAFDRTTGKLTANSTPRVTTAAGAGPRHMVFHPNAKYAYVINESASTMVAYAHDGSGRLTEMQSLSTRAATGGNNSTAEVGMHPTGKWLYGSNRNDSNIVQYAIGETDGRMTLVGHTDSGGTTPRSFSIDPSGQFMFVANQGSNSIVVFRIGADGKLQRAGNPLVIAGSSPTFVGVAALP